MTIPSFIETPNFETFKAAYQACMLFADLPEENSELGAENISEQAEKQIWIDCVYFYGNYAHFWGDSHEQAGHDFWLTRNGHGAGFWDRGETYKDAGQYLTMVSEAIGVQNLSVDDESNLIYLS